MVTKSGAVLQALSPKIWGSLLWFHLCQLINESIFSCNEKGGPSSGWKLLVADALPLDVTELLSASCGI